MPYKTIWEPSPRNMDLKVWEELPEDVEERDPQFFNPIRVARGYHEGEYHRFYFCHHCKGWIRGEAYEFSINTLAPHQLAGRQGTEYYCLHCGEQIGFFGVMS